MLDINLPEIPGYYISCFITFPVLSLWLSLNIPESCYNPIVRL